MSRHPLPLFLTSELLGCEGETSFHFRFLLETTNMTTHVYLLSIETEIFENSRSRNTKDVRKDWNIHNTKLMTIAGLRINNINTQYNLSSL